MEVRSTTGKHHDTPGFHGVFARGHRIHWYLQHFVHLDKKQILLLCCVSVQCYGFRLLMPERKGAKPRGFCRVRVRTSNYFSTLGKPVSCDRVAKSLVFALLRTPQERQSLFMRFWG